MPSELSSKKALELAKIEKQTVENRLKYLNKE